MDLTAKEATVSQVIQEGRGLMDQLERGMKETGHCPCSLTLKLYIIIHNKPNNYVKRIHPSFVKHILPKCAKIVPHIYLRGSLLLAPTEIFHFPVKLCLSRKILQLFHSCLVFSGYLQAYIFYCHLVFDACNRNVCLCVCVCGQW